MRVDGEVFGKKLLKTAECFAHIFKRNVKHIATTCLTNDDNKLIKDKSVMVMDCRPSITGQLINCDNIIKNITITELATAEEDMRQPKPPKSIIRPK